MQLRFDEAEEDVEKRDAVECLRNIAKIPEGTIPLSRELGLSWAGVSKTAPELENDYVTELVTKADRFEPRIAIDEVNFQYDSDGKVTVTVRMEETEDDE